MSASLSPREATQIEEEGLVLVGQAEEIVVRDQASFEAAGSFLVAIKGYQARVHAVMDPIVKAADEAHRVALRQRALLLDPAQEAEATVKRALTAYEQAERDRIAAARRAQEAAARQAAEAAKARQVEALRESGQTAAAETVAAAPPPVVITPPPPPAPKVRGVSFRDKWSAVVTNFKDLVAAVAAGTQPLDLLQPNEEALNGMARTFKQNLAIPGVEAKHERVAAGSR